MAAETSVTLYFLGHKRDLTEILDKTSWFSLEPNGEEYLEIYCLGGLFSSHKVQDPNPKGWPKREYSEMPPTRAWFDHPEYDFPSRSYLEEEVRKGRRICVNFKANGETPESWIRNLSSAFPNVLIVSTSECCEYYLSSDSCYRGGEKLLFNVWDWDDELGRNFFLANEGTEEQFDSCYYDSCREASNDFYNEACWEFFYGDLLKESHPDSTPFVQYWKSMSPDAHLRSWVGDSYIPDVLIRMYIHTGANVNRFGENLDVDLHDEHRFEETPLIEALLRWNGEKTNSHIRILLEAGADPNCKGTIDVAPIGLAQEYAAEGDSEAEVLVKLLVNSVTT